MQNIDPGTRISETTTTRVGQADTSLGRQKPDTGRDCGSSVPISRDSGPISLADKHDTRSDTANKDVTEKTESSIEAKSEDDTAAECSPVLTTTKLPPLEDPSVILLSPSQPRKYLTESNNADCRPPPIHPIIQADEEIETLAEEVKHIKEDKAVEFLKEELKDKIVDMIAYQKHNGANADTKVDPEELNMGQGNVTNHFLELKQKQRQAQKEFHQKLLCELGTAGDREESGGETRNSAVAEALGASWEVKVQKNPVSSCSQYNSLLAHSKSSHQVHIAIDKTLIAIKSSSSSKSSLFYEHKHKD